MSRTQIWNNGGGTQSAALAALIVSGKIEKPDLAVIADTGYEKSSTWDYLDNYVAPALESVGVVMHRIKASDYSTVGLYGGKDSDTLLIPAFTTQGNEIGKLPNFCSGEWKRNVIRRWATNVHGVAKAINWIGYSTDEIARAYKAKNSSQSKGKWQLNFPLINLGLNRGDCVSIVEKMGWPTPPRSSCWMCPNMHVGEWRDVMSDERDRLKVIRFDREIRKRDPNVWLTDQAVPIEEADFDDKNEVLFGRDRGGCESGMCFL